MESIKKFLNEEQDPKSVEKILTKINQLLMKEEEVIYIAVQKKPAVTFSPDCVALTNKRVIFFQPKSFGLSMDFKDFIWKDIHDCHIKEEIFGAEFSVRTIKNQIMKVDYLPKAQARKLYTYAQEQEQVQREYRRQLELEDKRAAAGQINVSAQSAPISAVPITPTTDDPMVVLKKLKSMLEAELIDQAEFDAKKAEILSRL